MAEIAKDTLRSSRPIAAHLRHGAATLLGGHDTEGRPLTRAYDAQEALPIQAEQLGQRVFPFRDARYLELLFRYRARNWPQSLEAGEQVRWDAFRRTRLTKHTSLTALTLDDYFARLAELRADPQAQGKIALLDQLQAWGEELAASI